MTRPFEVGRDYPTFVEWCEKAGIHPAGRMPKIGVVGDELAMGFLVQTDAEYCLISYLITGNGPEIARGNACLNAIEELLRVARAQGYKVALILAEKPSVADVAIRLGALETFTKVLEGSL